MYTKKKYLMSYTFLFFFFFFLFVPSQVTILMANNMTNPMQLMVKSIAYDFYYVLICKHTLTLAESRRESWLCGLYEPLC
jgi:hypothetical protein